MINDSKLLNETKYNELNIKYTELTNKYNSLLKDTDIKMKDIKIHYKNKIEKIKTQHIIDIKEINNKHDEHIKLLTKEITDLTKEAINSSKPIYNDNSHTKNSTRNITHNIAFCNNNFPNAPYLDKINNFKINGVDYNKLENEESQKSAIEELIFRLEDKTLDKYIGKHLVKIYKNSDPKKQSFYSSDSSRNNYLIKMMLEIANNINDNKNNKSNTLRSTYWMDDKRGIKLTELIITPLISKLCEVAGQYFNHLNEYFKTSKCDTSTNEYIMIKKLWDLVTFLRESKELIPDIHKYIAPYFNLPKINVISNKKNSTDIQDINNNSDIDDSDSDDDSIDDNKKNSKIKIKNNKLLKNETS
jgi:hypothetical protein